ncbi:MAG: hypothetical protein KKF50_03250 [Nanoarchaeota archaeon]|nr:hypothetical protein [Nanoarchaeota archaeon]
MKRGLVLLVILFSLSFVSAADDASVFGHKMTEIAWTDLNACDAGEMMVGISTSGTPSCVSASFSSLSAPDGIPSPALSVDNDGNVGIGTGTASLTQPLTLGGLNDNGLLLSGTKPWIQLTSGHGVGYLRIRQTPNVFDIAGDNTPITFSSGTPAGTYPERMRITTGGNVGIGTTDPGVYKLNVAGNTKITGNLDVTGTSSNFPSHYYHNLYSGNVVYEHAFPVGYGFSSGTTKFVWRAGDGVSSYRTLTWDGANGGKLSVAGNLDVTGTISGGGAGLDADTLDGIQGSDYTREDLTMLGKTGSVSLDAVTNTAAEWSALPVGYSRMISSAIGISGGAPTNNHGYFVKTANRDTAGGWGGIWVGYGAGENYMGRISTSASFASWDKLWSDANDGAGSGLDADLLDGQSGAYYLDNVNTQLSEATVETFVANDIGTGYIPRDNGIKFENSPIYATSSTGNVGIGTADPGVYKLNVVGNTKITGNLEVTGAISGGGSGGWYVPSDIKATSTTHNGNFGGYDGMYTWIQSNGCSGYHVCDGTEVTRYLQTKDIAVANGRYWYNVAMVQYQGGNMDCTGWQGNQYGMVYEKTSSGENYNLDGCGTARAVLCCKE